MIHNMISISGIYLHVHCIAQCHTVDQFVVRIGHKCRSATTIQVILNMTNHLLGEEQDVAK